MQGVVAGIEIGGIKADVAEVGIDPLRLAGDEGIEFAVVDGVPVLISRSSLPLSTITTLDCEIPAGGGSGKVIDPVQSELTVYVPVAVLDGMMVPFKPTVVVCEAFPTPSKEIVPRSATNPTGPSLVIDPVVAIPYDPKSVLKSHDLSAWSDSSLACACGTN
jgi:hypothetical protein